MPSTCAGSMPASAIAASHASTARRRSERPESFENSVAPIPTMAPASSRLACRSLTTAPRHDGSTSVTVPLTWSPRRVRAPDAHLDDAVGLAGHGPGHRHRVARIVGRTEADLHRLEQRVRAGPVGDVAPDEPVAGEDVHEDVGRAALVRQPRVVVDVLVVARRDRGGDDQRAGERDRQRRELVADVHVVVARVRRVRVVLTRGPPSPRWCRRAGRASRSAPPSVSSICLPHRKYRWTG